MGGEAVRGSMDWRMGIRKGAVCRRKKSLYSKSVGGDIWGFDLGRLHTSKAMGKEGWSLLRPAVECYMKYEKPGDFSVRPANGEGAAVFGQANIPGWLARAGQKSKRLERQVPSATGTDEVESQGLDTNELTMKSEKSIFDPGVRTGRV